MSFNNIKNIAEYTLPQIGQNEYYFFDANVWIYILFYGNKADAPETIAPYIDFFDKVVSLNLSREKIFKHRPKIVMTSVLFTEIVGTYLVKRAKEAYCIQQWEEKKEELIEKYKNKRLFIYKYDINDYRETEHYKTQCDFLLIRFNQYSNYIHPVIPDFSSKKMTRILSLYRKYNFCGINDFYYYYLCMDKGWTMVTNDSDFKFTSIRIITNLKKLLDLRDIQEKSIAT
ncbi:MAG: hypothetical protein HY841_07060 [Bacteroidetes bacterium]|nr:hypothetical protein [Bacteroidota bacterium]